MCVKLHTVCIITHSVLSYTLCVKYTLSIGVPFNLIVKKLLSHNCIQERGRHTAWSEMAFQGRNQGKESKMGLVGPCDIENNNPRGHFIASWSALVDYCFPVLIQIYCLFQDALHCMLTRQ